MLSQLNPNINRVVGSSDINDTSKVTLNYIETSMLKHQEDYRLTHGKVNNLYFATKWGGFLTARPTPLSDKARQSYDPRKRPWYKKAVQNPTTACFK